MAATILQSILEYFEQNAALNDAFPGGMWPDFAPESVGSKPYVLLIDHEEDVTWSTAGHADDAGLEEAMVTLRVTAAGMKAADTAAQVVKDQFDFQQDQVPMDGTGNCLLSERKKYKLKGIDKISGGQPITFGDVTYKFWVADQHH